METLESMNKKVERAEQAYTSALTNYLDMQDGLKKLGEKLQELGTKKSALKFRREILMRMVK